MACGIAINACRLDEAQAKLSREEADCSVMEPQAAIGLGDVLSTCGRARPPVAVADVRGKWITSGSDQGCPLRSMCRQDGS